MGKNVSRTMCRKVTFQSSALGFGLEDRVIQGCVHGYFPDRLTPCLPRSAPMSTSLSIHSFNFSGLFYFSLWWASIAAHRLSLVSMGWALCCGVWVSHCSAVSRHTGFSRGDSRALGCRLRRCSTSAQLLHSMWDIPRPGVEPVSPALAVRCVTVEPPRKPSKQSIFKANLSWHLSSVNSLGKLLKMLNNESTSHAHQKPEWHRQDIVFWGFGADDSTVQSWQLIEIHKNFQPLVRIASKQMLYQRLLCVHFIPFFLLLCNQLWSSTLCLSHLLFLSY